VPTLSRYTVVDVADDPNELVTMVLEDLAADAIKVELPQVPPGLPASFDYVE
jgi:crotonobetainyl-CoA:carnitine CoA-transferase CaiB-like acyl-CoA transferase